GACLRDGLVQAVLEFQGGVMALQFEQHVTCGDLYDRRHVAARAYRHAQHRDLDVEDGVRELFDAQPVILFAFAPVHEHDHELDLLRDAYGGDAEKIFDVDDAEAADLHVVAYDLASRAKDRVRRPFSDIDDVVRDEAVSAHDQIE